MSRRGDETTDALPGASTASPDANALRPPFLVPLGSQEQPGDQVGAYKLLEKIGEGGFGVVYVAEQRVPIRRRVALKIIKLGMDTQSVVARFEAERQALAMMDHPHIAKVLDAGATERGRPFFAMEFVRGVPITDYCDQHHLPPVERLRLFIQVCQAIQHAHQKGIIHRDIKPSNILVTVNDGAPVPKVIDFGIAKATQGDLTEKTIYTQHQQVIGTPAYMSPEQAEMSGLDVDTRSDIYSLGVLLYELLTGATPFDARELMRAGMDEMRRMIRQAEPPRPSTRLSGMARADSTSAAAGHGMDAQRLISLLRGDLDWIVMRCLEKDRTRRYETANALAMDVQRHLNVEPVLARPPTSTYRARKFVRRNKLGVAAGAAVLGSVLAGLGLATAGFVRASEERDRARAAHALADANFESARAAVAELLRISNDRLKDLPGMQPLRLELMAAAIDRYTPFLATPLPDPRPRAALARLRAHYALLEYHSTSTPEAMADVVANLVAAQAIQEQLLREHPGDPALTSDLGWTLILRTWLAADAAPPSTAERTRAIDLFRALMRADPSDPFARDDFVWATYVYSRRRADLNARAISDEGIAVGEALVAEFPRSAEFRRDLANALEDNALGRFSGTTLADDPAARLAVGRRTFDMRKAVFNDLTARRPDALLPRRPDDSEGRIVSPSLLYAKCDMAWSETLEASAHRSLKDWHALADTWDRSARIWEEIVDENPAVLTFATNLADVFEWRVDAAKTDDDRARVVEWSRDAVDFWARQATLHPDLPVFQRLLDKARRRDADLAKDTK